MIYIFHLFFERFPLGRVGTWLPVEHLTLKANYGHSQYLPNESCHYMKAEAINDSFSNLEFQ